MFTIDGIDGSPPMYDGSVFNFFNNESSYPNISFSTFYVW
jgi:hypothetical protein